MLLVACSLTFSCCPGEHCEELLCSLLIITLLNQLHIVAAASLCENSVWPGGTALGCSDLACSCMRKCNWCVVRSSLAHRYILWSACLNMPYPCQMLPLVAQSRYMFHLLPSRASIEPLRADIALLWPRAAPARPQRLPRQAQSPQSLHASHPPPA